MSAARNGVISVHHAAGTGSGGETFSVFAGWFSEPGNFSIWNLAAQEDDAAWTTMKEPITYEKDGPKGLGRTPFECFL